jgi:hypothetical protein
MECDTDEQGPEVTHVHDGTVGKLMEVDKGSERGGLEEPEKNRS